MITNPKHPIAQKLLERIRNDHIKNVDGQESVVDLLVCPSFEDALLIRLEENGGHIYRIERNTYRILESLQVSDRIGKIVKAMLGKQADEISPQMDGTIVFMRIAGGVPEYIFIDLPAAVDDVELIAMAIGKSYDWIKGMKNSDKSGA